MLMELLDHECREFLSHLKYINIKNIRVHILSVGFGHVDIRCTKTQVYLHIIIIIHYHYHYHYLSKYLRDTLQHPRFEVIIN